MPSSPHLIVTNAHVYTCDPSKPWAEAFAVSDGRIAAVGDTTSIRELASNGTESVDVGGAMVVPGLGDVHAHLSLGGTRLAWELDFPPTLDLDGILARTADRAATLAEDEWVIGGIIGSPVLDRLALGGFLPALDKAAGGRPVMLRDDSHHNRWVNSRALELMGVNESTPDPDGGRFVRDQDGALTGVLYESACSIAEAVAFKTVTNHAERERVAMRTAVRMMNSLGITAVQDAATMEYSLQALAELADSDELSAWVVASLPVRPSFLAEGITGEELYAVAPRYRRDRVRPDFVKFYLDGVPMTRTSALLDPYICHGAHEDPGDTGPLFFSDDELIGELKRCHELGFGAKLHATGDRSVRQALDAIEYMRLTEASGKVYQIAHVAYVSEADQRRFSRLNVIADASPYIWFPTPFQESIDNQVPPSIVDHSWPFRSLIDRGTVLAAGSDWPVLPVPNPWIAMEAMVTRANPDRSIDGTCNPDDAVTVSEAIAAFTSNTAKALGMNDTIGSIAPGYSADFVVLSQNLFNIIPTEIHRTRALQTFFRGQKVYDQRTTVEDSNV